MILVLFKKRGVNVKAKIKLLESISVLIVIIVIAYFFGVKGTNLEYKSLDDSRSTANYIEMETIDDVKNLENLKTNLNNYKSMII